MTALRAVSFYQGPPVPANCGRLFCLVVDVKNDKYPFDLTVDVKNEKYMLWTLSINRFIYLVAHLEPTFNLR